MSLQDWANLGSAVSGAIAVISLIISFKASSKSEALSVQVETLKQEIKSIGHVSQQGQKNVNQSAVGDKNSQSSSIK